MSSGRGVSTTGAGVSCWIMCGRDQDQGSSSITWKSPFPGIAGVGKIMDGCETKKWNIVLRM